MCDGTVPVPDNSDKRAFLCRDPVYPLWIERTITNASAGLHSYGGGTWSIPARANSTLVLPVWSDIIAQVNTATADGESVAAGDVADLTVIGTSPSAGFAIFISPGAKFIYRIYTGAAGGGTGIECEFNYQVGGEEFTFTAVAAPVSDGFLIAGEAGKDVLTTGTLMEGLVPVGFVSLRAMRTTATAPTAAANPYVRMSWSSAGNDLAPSGTVTMFTPYAMPPEFNNSTLPYGRTRLNSSAALFTNVTAALSKEGTILAARLKPSVVDPWNFNLSHLNSVHPSLRYFGPLEKGLYTFTTPSGNLDNFDDCWTTMASASTFNNKQRPLFNYRDVGLYNAMVFSDLGSSSTGTQLAVSSYAHLEFETTSSLFAPGVSMLTLETLHATEVALLKFGHFHENPIHWAALSKAALNAIRVVGPMVAPVVQHYGQKLLDSGVAYLRTKKGGDRTMQQELAPRPQKAPRKVKVQKQKVRSRR
jgi:hypothetical protein